MSTFTASDPQFEARVRTSFVRQQVMKTLGASLTSVIPGEVTIEMPFDEAFTQQNGYLHAGTVTTLVDSACGYAALSLMPADAEVLSVEFKVNFLSPAAGRKFIATGRVLKPGRTLSVTMGAVVAESDTGSKTVATIMATMITIRPSGTP